MRDLKAVEVTGRSRRVDTSDIAAAGLDKDEVERRVCRPLSMTKTDSNFRGSLPC